MRERDSIHHPLRLLLGLWVVGLYNVVASSVHDIPFSVDVHVAQELASIRIPLRHLVDLPLSGRLGIFPRVLLLQLATGKRPGELKQPFSNTARTGPRVIRRGPFEFLRVPTGSPKALVFLDLVEIKRNRKVADPALVWKLPLDVLSGKIEMLAD